jgi:NAD(P)H-hydrate epimerase
MRSGAGLVTLAVPESITSAVIRRKPLEVMLLPLAESKERTVSLKAWQQVRGICRDISLVVIGPGLTCNTATSSLIKKVVAGISLPMIIDADGLNALRGYLDLLRRKAVTVITPHPGELARLLGTSAKTIQKNRKTIAKDFASKYNVEIVLKGERTVVAGSKGKVYVNSTGNPGMATAGSGDVLTGMIAAFLAQRLEPFDACKFGVYVHGLAGDLAAKVKTQPGMIASDIIENIPKALRKCS